MFTIFRRFATLHSRCLLLAQDELSALEARLQAVDAAERTQLYLSSRLHDENAVRQSLLDEIRSKLRNYDDDLLRLFRLCALDSPREESVASFARWMNAVKPLIRGESEFLKHTEDFVTVQGQMEEGFLEELIEKLLAKFGTGRYLLQREKDRRKSVDPDLYYCSARRRSLLARLILTGFASCLLLVPTSLLYVVRGTSVRLIIITVFTLIFATTVALITNAKRHEIFASMAA